MITSQQETHTMTSQQILGADVLDILFENRNKTYGAYELRKTYPLRLLKALGGMALLVIALLFFGNSSSTKTAIEKINDGYILREVPIPEQKQEEPKEKPQTQPVQKLKQEILQTQMKVVDRQPLITMATQDQLKDAVIGSERIDGAPTTGIQQPSLQTTIDGSVTKPEEPSHNETILPNRQPQFPGGIEAWRNFLSRYLQAPQELEQGEKRTVIVRFWVDEEGTVTNFQVVQSGGAAFDNEVIRVLKKMPKWLPAIQNGRPVAISFSQPVTFTAAEE